MTLLRFVLFIWMLSTAYIASADPFKITISIRQDTLYSYPDSMSLQSYYHRSDSLITITIENTGKSDLKLHDVLCIGYPEDDFTDIYFNTWYTSGGILKEYHGHSASIDQVESPFDTIPTVTLKPGEKLNIYEDPFDIYGDNDTPGLYKLQAVYNDYASNIVSVFFAGTDTISAMDIDGLEYYAGKYYKAGQYYAAAAMYSKLSQRERYNSRWYYDRGMCGWSAGKYEDAFRWFGRAVYQAPDNVEYRLKYAESLYKDKVYEEASRQYKEILRRIEALDSTIPYLKNKIQLSEHKQQEADEVDVIKLSFKASDYEREEKYDSAVAIYNRIQQLDSAGFYDYSSRGYCYYKLNDLNKAMVDLDKDINRSPKYANGYFYRSLVFERLGKYPEACTDLEISLSSLRANSIKEEFAQEIARIEKHCK